MLRILNSVVELDHLDVTCTFPKLAYSPTWLAVAGSPSRAEDYRWPMTMTNKSRLDHR